MGHTADVCVSACVRKGDKEKEKIKEGFGPVTPRVRLPGIISRHNKDSQSRQCSLAGPRSHHSTVTSRVTLQHTSVVWCVVSFFSLFFFGPLFPLVKPPRHLSSQSHTNRSLSA